MKKLLSILLVLSMMISLCTAFAATAVFADDSVFLTDEYDATKLGFSAEVYEAGREGVAEEDRLLAAQPYVSCDVDALEYLYNNGYKGNEKKGTEYYAVYDSERKTCEITTTQPTAEGAKYAKYVIPSAKLVTKAKQSPHYGGYYITAEGSLPINKFPIDIDVHLSDDGVITSGVRIYPRSTEKGGYIMKYQVWVKFADDEEWTYLYTDGNRSGGDATITTAFGYNAKVKDIRIKVLEGAVKSNANSYAKGETAYFNLSAVTVLKPYNGESATAGGASYSINVPKTVTSASDIDEIMTVTKATVTRHRHEWASTDNAMDDDLSTSARTNGQLTMDFGENVRFSGIRIYPPKASDVGGKSGSTDLYLKQLNGIAVTGLPLNRADETKTGIGETYKTTFYATYIEALLDTNFKDTSGNIIYPTDSNGEYDYTKPVTVMFKTDITSRSILVDGYANLNPNNSSESLDAVGEIRLIKPQNATDPYLDGTIPWDGEQTVEITRNDEKDPKTGDEYGVSGRQVSLTDGVVWDYKPAADNYIFASTDYAGLKDGSDKVEIAIDLGEQKTFSGVRVVGRLAQPSQALMLGTLSFSDDGEHWVAGYYHMASRLETKDGVRINGQMELVSGGSTARIYTDSESLYTDMLVRSEATAYNIKARYVKITVLRTWDEPHWSAQEIALVEPNSSLGDPLTVTQFAAAAIDSRVAGSVEQARGIANAAYYESGMTDTERSALSVAEESYKGAEVTENDDRILTAGGATEHREGDSCGSTNTPSKFDSKNADYMIDGAVSGSMDVGRDNFTRGDHCVQVNGNESLNLCFTLSGEETFSGIRFYARKSDNTTAPIAASRPHEVQLKLTDKDGKTYVTSGIINSTPSSDGRYADIMLTRNGEGVTVTGVTQIDVEIQKLFKSGTNYHAHFGSEEVRLLTDTTISKTSTLAEIAEASVTSKEIVADTGVIGENGIIRFITEFEKIADGAEIEYFGTYVINNSRYSSSSVEFSGGNVGKYEVGTGEGQYSAPEVGNTFSVDVKGIDSGYYETGVTAVSFVKIAGYENPIILNVKQGVTVNGDRTVELPKAETTTED